MTTQELKNNIEKVLGNSLRCLLPSYWWKKLFHSVADRIDEVEQKIDGIEIPDGVPIVNYKSELNGLKLPKGSVASVVTEGYGFSQCYLPTAEEISEGIEAVFPKLTRIMSIERRDNQLEESEVGIAFLIGRDYPNTALMVTCQVVDGAQLYAATGKVNDKDVTFYIPTQSQQLNDILAENDLRLLRIGLDFEQGVEEMLATLDKVFAINGTSDVYTKGASWEKLAKESDIQANVQEGSECIFTFGIDTNASEFSAITSDEEKAANIEAWDKYFSLINKGMPVKLRLKWYVIISNKKTYIYDVSFESAGQGVLFYPTYSGITFYAVNLFNRMWDVIFNETGEAVLYTSVSMAKTNTLYAVHETVGQGLSREKRDANKLLYHYLLSGQRYPVLVSMRYPSGEAVFSSRWFQHTDEEGVMKIRLFVIGDELFHMELTEDGEMTILETFPIIGSSAV